MGRMCLAVALFMVLTMALVPAPAVAAGKLLVSLFGESGGVAVIDTAAWDAWGVIPTGPMPAKLISSADDDRVFVSIYGSDKVAVIDPAKDAVVGAIKIGRAPYSMDISPDGTRLVVANARGRSLSLVDTGSLSQIKKVDTKGRPEVVKISPDGKLVYVINEHVNMQVFILEGLTLEKEIEIPDGVNDMAFSRDGGLMYMNNLEVKEVAVMDTASMEVVKNIPAYGVQGLEISPDGKELWFGGPDNRITVYSLADDAVVKTLPRDGGGTFLDITFSPDGKLALASPAGEQGDRVYVYDAASREFMKEVEVQGRPRYLLYLR